MKGLSRDDLFEFRVSSDQIKDRSKRSEKESDALLRWCARLYWDKNWKAIFPGSDNSRTKQLFTPIFQFLLSQAFADDEASTRLLQILLFLLLSTASLMFIPCAIRSPFTLSIHFFGCLPLLLVPSTCPYSATAGSLFPSILVTCPNHVSLLFLILSM